VELSKEYRNPKLSQWLKKQDKHQRTEQEDLSKDLSMVYRKNSSNIKSQRVSVFIIEVETYAGWCDFFLDDISLTEHIAEYKDTWAETWIK